MDFRYRERINKSMTKIHKIENFTYTTPPGAGYISLLKEHGNVVSVQYYSDPEGRKPIVLNVAPKAMVVTKESFAELIGENSSETVKKIAGQPAQKTQSARKLRKAEKGGDGDKTNDSEDHRGPMKFPHSEAEEEWAKAAEHDPKKNTWDYPTYRQTGIDSSQWIHGHQVEKILKSRYEEVCLNSKDILTENQYEPEPLKDEEEVKSFVDDLYMEDEIEQLNPEQMNAVRRVADKLRAKLTDSIKADPEFKRLLADAAEEQTYEAITELGEYIVKRLTGINEEQEYITENVILKMAATIVGISLASIVAMVFKGAGMGAGIILCIGLAVMLLMGIGGTKTGKL